MGIGDDLIYVGIALAVGLAATRYGAAVVGQDGTETAAIPLVTPFTAASLALWFVASFRMFRPVYTAILMSLLVSISMAVIFGGFFWLLVNDTPLRSFVFSLFVNEKVVSMFNTDVDTMESQIQALLAISAQLMSMSSEYAQGMLTAIASSARTPPDLFSS